MKKLITAMMILAPFSGQYATASEQMNDDHVPCGLKGTIDERIKDCQPHRSHNHENFLLVTRTKMKNEVYKETKTGLLWGDVMNTPTPFSHLFSDHEAALSACSDKLDEVGKIKGLRWRLPLKGEFKIAHKNGITKALPKMRQVFWTSSDKHYSDPYGSNKATVYVWIFDGHSGKFSEEYVDYNAKIRCVAWLGAFSHWK